MTPRHMRFYVVLGILTGVASSVFLAAMASRENIMFYYDPSQVEVGQAPVLKRFRVGGMVVALMRLRSYGIVAARFLPYKTMTYSYNKYYVAWQQLWRSIGELQLILNSGRGLNSYRAALKRV